MNRVRVPIAVVSRCAVAAFAAGLLLAAQSEAQTRTSHRVTGDYNTTMGDAAYQENDYGGALTWYLKAAEEGDAVAQYKSGWIYENGGNGVDQDYDQARELFLQSARQGDADAENGLGDLYYYGDGVASDASAAFRWYSLAAKQGQEDAEFSLGWLYAKRRGCRR